MSTAAPLYPIALRLEGLACLVVGGGRIATRKATALIDCGGEVTVIAPEICAELAQLPVRQLKRRYQQGDASAYRLIIAATGDPDVDRAVFADGELSGALVNAADDPAGCRFYLPAVLRRGAVTVAVSTGGSSPYLAGRIRDRLADVIGPEFGRLVELIGKARSELRQHGRSTEDVDWDSLVDEHLVATIAAGGDSEVTQRIDSWVQQELSRPRRHHAIDEAES